MNMTAATLPPPATTPVAPHPFFAAPIEANSTGSPATTTTTAPIISACGGHDDPPPLRPRSRTSSDDKIFKVYKYVDQSLLEDSANAIQLLRAENSKLKQKMQRQEQMMKMLLECHDAHQTANSMAWSVLQSLRREQQQHQLVVVPNHHHHNITLSDACDALEEALRWNNVLAHKDSTDDDLP